MAIKGPYQRPYFDSAIFISWLKPTDDGPLADGTRGDRHPISARVMLDAESGVYQIVTSYLTMAEVFKKKGDSNQPLTDEQNGQIVKYFESGWIDWVPLERLVGEEANKLLVQYRKEGLRPCDAVHLASALRAKCDVLLTWDGPLRDVKHPGIRIEFPEIFVPAPVYKQGSVFDAYDEQQPIETPGRSGEQPSEAAPDTTATAQHAGESKGSSEAAAQAEEEAPRAAHAGTGAEPSGAGRADALPEREASGESEGEHETEEAEGDEETLA